jgi:hypothetical protein
VGAPLPSPPMGSLEERGGGGVERVGNLESDKGIGQGTWGRIRWPFPPINPELSTKGAAVVSKSNVNLLNRDKFNYYRTLY